MVKEKLTPYYSKGRNNKKTTGIKTEYVDKVKMKKKDIVLKKKKHSGGSKIFKFISLGGKEYKLNPKEKKFCEFYLSFDGCGTEAYEQAGYECKNRNVAKSGAWQLGQKEHINAYINKLLNDQGFEDKNVAKQHLFLINQHADLASKSRGIDMFYKLGGKYAAEKVKFIDENEKITDEELDDERDRLEAEKHRQKQLNKKKAKSA